MAPLKIIYLSHCLLNTAAKVKRGEKPSAVSEESARQRILRLALENDIQMIQLPCPEFTAFGPRRWGHTREQFDNIFYREHCRKILAPTLMEMEAYSDPSLKDRFHILGIIGVEGSPSCGVKKSCSSPTWGGEFSSHQDIGAALATIRVSEAPGVFMDVLRECLEEAHLDIPIFPLDSRDLSPLEALIIN